MKLITGNHNILGTSYYLTRPIIYAFCMMPTRFKTLLDFIQNNHEDELKKWDSRSLEDLKSRRISL